MTISLKKEGTLFFYMVKVGIIGGSGLDDPQILENFFEKEVETPYGIPSSKLTCGKINGVEVVILARHGKHHEIYPTGVNYKANIYALKQEGCTHIIGTSAVGSLREEIKPGDLIFVDQFIDFTKFRNNTFFDKFGDVRHVSMADSFSKELRELFTEVATELRYPFHETGTIVVVEGPRFSSRAESYMFRSFAEIIGMTTFPEVALANELEIPYASIAMSTDYDCWKEDEEPVSFEMVIERMKENSNKVKDLILKVLPRLSNDISFIKSKIRTVPDFPKKGIMFRDITTLLLDPEGMNKMVNILVERYKKREVDVVAGIESRGFIIGAILAEKLGVAFVPIRKSGKLPYETISQEYELEYGFDKVEIHKDAIKKGQKIILVDDLIATGGTAEAGARLIEKLGGIIEEICFVIELPELMGRRKLVTWSVYSMVCFDGE